MADSETRGNRIPQGIARRSQEPAGWVPLRGPSGRLYGYLDPQTQTIELKRKGEQPERIELGALLKR